MFNFFKKSESVFADPCGDLLEKVYALEQKKPEFDPYNLKTLRRTITVEEKIMQLYDDFFSRFGPDDMNKTEYKTACDSYEIEKEKLDWDFEVLSAMEKILELAENGALQKDIKNALPDSQACHVAKICKRFEADGMIKREKRGSTYFITR